MRWPFQSAPPIMIEALSAERLGKMRRLTIFVRSLRKLEAPKDYALSLRFQNLRLPACSKFSTKLIRRHLNVYPYFRF